MSPYPTVHNVVKAQYIDTKYLVPRLESKYEYRVTQVSGPNPSILAEKYQKQAARCKHSRIVKKLLISRIAEFFIEKYS